MQNKFDFYCEEVLTGKTPVTKVFESENILAFHHTKPSYQTHIVVIPKIHIPDFSSLSDQEWGIINKALKVAIDISNTLDMESGVRIITNMGKFQDTPHVHFHLVGGEKI